MEHPIAPVDLSNSPRIRQLLRSGNIYLSLSDAIALAIENNLDIQLERYTLPAADTEVLRAKGGGLLRGLTYNVFEVPVGVGGPASPLVTSAATPTRGRGGIGADQSFRTRRAVRTAGQSFACSRPFRFPAARRFHSSTRRSPGNSIGRIRPRPTRIQLAYGDQRLSRATPPTPTPPTRKGFGPGTELNVGIRQLPEHNQLSAERL